MSDVLPIVLIGIISFFFGLMIGWVWMALLAAGARCPRDG